MAYGYWKLGMSEKEATFQLSFRNLPRDSDFIVAAGLQLVIDFLHNFKFTDADLVYLSSLSNGQGPLLSTNFLTYLKQLKFTCRLDAVPEGSLIFANEPILRVQGPILQCQLLETTLINLCSFSSLIATKAANICHAAKGDPIIEFGLRRAQGPDGGITASRSAYIGGCSGTSNALAGKLFDIPTHGTQAHSWIMAFDTEIRAFQQFADVMGNNTILLVDTYHTLDGIKNAIKVGHILRERGQDLVAIRLDSGDLLSLSQQARKLLDDASLRNTKIIASGDLDEFSIQELKRNAAPIDSWGVGTRLVTAYDQPAMNSIYKLTAIKNSEDSWDYKMKISDDRSKSTFPGILQVKRFQNKKDVIYDVLLGENFASPGKDLLEGIYRKGELIYIPPTIHQIREFCHEQREKFSKNAPKPYPVEIGHNLRKLMHALSRGAV